MRARTQRSGFALITVVFVLAALFILCAPFLFTALRSGFTWYATDVARYESFFGPISTVISLLVFLHLASMVVLLGAEVARANVLEDDEASDKKVDS